MINDHDYGTIGQRHTSFVEDSTPAPTALYKVLASSLDTTDSIYVINNPVGSVLKLPCCVRLGIPTRLLDIRFFLYITFASTVHMGLGILYRGPLHSLGILLRRCSAWSDFHSEAFQGI